MKRRYITAIPIAAIAVMLMGASSCDGTGTSSVNSDQTVSNNQLGSYEQSQPVPAFNWSQLRATLIAVETGQATTTQTTTFFYNMGSNVPVSSCPSIGFPLAATDQLTNPSQLDVQPDPNAASGSVTGVISQIDPNGVYTGNTTGTYVLCVSPDGGQYVTYWEGFTATVSGAAQIENGQITLVGPSTIKIKAKGS